MCKPKKLIKSNPTDQSDEKLYNQLSCYIDKDFLIRMTKEIMSSDEYKEIDESNLYIDRYVNKKFSIEKLEYLVPVIITMVHLYECTPFNSQEEVNELYSDSDYIIKLKSQVIFELSTKILRGNDEMVYLFSYTPILYFMIGVLDSLLDCYAEGIDFSDRIKAKPNYEFKHDTYKELFEIARSICTLLDSGDYANAYALMRKFIEMLIIYLYLKDDENAAVYYKNIGETKYKVFTSSEEWNKYKSDENNKGKTSINYFNYGWMKSLKNYSKDVELKFEDLTSKIKLENDQDEAFKMRWSDLYDYCCLFAHSNYYSAKYKIDHTHFLILTSTLGEMLQYVISEFSEFINGISFVTNGIDVLKVFNDAVDDSIEKRKKLIGK